MLRFIPSAASRIVAANHFLASSKCLQMPIASSYPSSNVEFAQKYSTQVSSTSGISRVPSGYMLFQQDNRKKLMSEIKGPNKISELIKRCAVLWKSLSEAQKEAYNNRSRELKGNKAAMREKLLPLLRRPPNAATLFFKTLPPLSSEGSAFRQHYTESVKQFPLLENAQKQKFIDEATRLDSEYNAKIMALTEEEKLELKKLRDDGKLRNLKNSQKKKLNILGKPKKPSTPYLLFAQTVTVPQPGVAGFLQRSKRAGELWKKMGDKEKQPFVEQFDKAKQEYSAKLVAWEADMKARGLGAELGPLKTHNKRA